MTMLNTTHITTKPSAETLRRRRRADRPAVRSVAPGATRFARRALQDGALDAHPAVESDGRYLRQLDGPHVLFDRLA